MIMLDLYIQCLFQKLEYDIMHFLNTCNIVQMLIQPIRFREEVKS